MGALLVGAGDAGGAVGVPGLGAAPAAPLHALRHRGALAATAQVRGVRTALAVHHACTLPGSS